MIQNFVKGIVFGGVVAGLGLAVVSEIAPLPAPHDGGMAQTEAPANDTAAPEQPAVDQEMGASETSEAPVIVDATPMAEEPDKVPLQPTVESAAPSALAPSVSGAMPEINAGTDALPPSVPPAVLPDVAAADTAPVAEDAPEALLMPMPEVSGQAPGWVVLDPPVFEPNAEPETTPMPEVAPAPMPQDQPLATLEPEPQPAPMPEIMAPVSELPKSVDGVTTGRLPSIGAAATATEAAAPVVDVPPLVKFARSFSNDAGKPLFSVVLQDTGEADLDRATLAALPFPVSFVIDPLAPTASEAAQIYRAAGQEVVMLASGIPKGAKASDLEQSFQANETVLPEAVAIMDIGTGGFQDNRPLATQVVPLIKAQGVGLLTFDRGLNAADQVARRDGVASAMIFRELDAQGEDTPLIRRYLDRAAFKAAQEGRVVVLGATRPETVAALMAWAVEGRAASVALAPISALMVK